MMRLRTKADPLWLIHATHRRFPFSQWGLVGVGWTRDGDAYDVGLDFGKLQRITIYENGRVLRKHQVYGRMSLLHAIRLGWWVLFKRTAVERDGGTG